MERQSAESQRAKTGELLEKLSKKVHRLVNAHLAGGDFETTRDELHALGPEAVFAVYARAQASEGEPEALHLLVTVLADVVYPPSLPWMRKWLDSDELDSLAFPAAMALGSLAPERFEGLDDIYTSDDATELLEEIANWWDSGKARIPTEAEWMTAQRARRKREIEKLPPEQPNLTSDQKEALRPDE